MYTACMFLDIATGIFISLLAAYSFDTPLTYPLLALAIISALLPDIDIFWYGIKRLLGSEQHDHRSFTHYPLLYIPVIGLVYIFFGGMPAVVLALGVYLHLLHDTIGMGAGIAWLAPFSYRKYQLWPVTEGDGHWIRNYYLRPCLNAYIEYGALLAALVCLYLFW